MGVAASRRSSARAAGAPRCTTGRAPGPPRGTEISAAPFRHLHPLRSKYVASCCANRASPSVCNTAPPVGACRAHGTRGVSSRHARARWGLRAQRQTAPARVFRRGLSVRCSPATARLVSRRTRQNTLRHLSRALNAARSVPRAVSRAVTSRQPCINAAPDADRRRRCRSRIS